MKIIFTLALMYGSLSFAQASPVYQSTYLCGKMISDDGNYLPREESAIYALEIKVGESESRLDLFVIGEATGIDGHVPELLKLNGNSVCVNGFTKLNEPWLFIKSFADIVVR